MQNVVLAKTINNKLSITLLHENEDITISDTADKYISMTPLQQKYTNLSINEKIQLITRLKKMGFESEAILKYLFPALYINLYNTINNIECNEKNAMISVIENTAKIKIINSKLGLKVDKNRLFSEIINNLSKFCSDKIKISTDEILPIIDDFAILNQSKLRAEFTTNFDKSISERKNNIKLALKALDGIQIKPGEVLSFNKIVGERTKEKGYQSAKIISRGEFVDAIGGGVCQVSTTLYNAALLAGLNIEEVHSHSLKIGYIEPGFDAMVNSGSSDLKIKNNTEGVITVATSSVGDICKVCIYGERNPYNYIRKYTLEECSSEIQKDYQVLQEGSKAEARMMVYKEGNLLEEKILREVVYKPLLKRIVVD